MVAGRERSAGPGRSFRNVREPHAGQAVAWPSPPPCQLTAGAPIPNLKRGYAAPCPTGARKHERAPAAAIELLPGALRLGEAVCDGRDRRRGDYRGRSGCPRKRPVASAASLGRPACYAVRRAVRLRLWTRFMWTCEPSIPVRDWRPAYRPPANSFCASPAETVSGCAGGQASSVARSVGVAVHVDDEGLERALPTWERTAAWWSRCPACLNTVGEGGRRGPSTRFLRLTRYGAAREFLVWLNLRPTAHGWLRQRHARRVTCSALKAGTSEHDQSNQFHQTALRRL
jgi:hypothetical protein